MADRLANLGGFAHPAKASTTTPKGGSMASSGKFIQGAIKRPGALTAKAKAAGMSIDAFARAHQHDSGVTGDEARFYLNVLSKTNRGGAAMAKAAAGKR